MTKIEAIDSAEFSFDIGRDLTVQPRQRQPGPPQRIDGMTVGILTLTEDAPHNGEMHPDGDEILHVISGRIQINYDSEPGELLILGPGQSCIIPKGEWHKVTLLEKAEIIHITPGPQGEHRPL